MAINNTVRTPFIALNKLFSELGIKRELMIDFTTGDLFYKGVDGRSDIIINKDYFIKLVESHMKEFIDKNDNEDPYNLDTLSKTIDELETWAKVLSSSSNKNFTKEIDTIKDVIDKFKGIKFDGKTLKMILNDYVEKVPKKGLSTCNFSCAECEKLKKIDFEANNYVHPKEKVCSFNNYIRSVNGKKGDVVLSREDVPYMPEENANNYSHPLGKQCMDNVVESVNGKTGEVYIELNAYKNVKNMGMANVDYVSKEDVNYRPKLYYATPCAVSSVIIDAVRKYNPNGVRYLGKFKSSVFTPKTLCDAIGINGIGELFSSKPDEYMEFHKFLYYNSILYAPTEPLVKNVSYNMLHTAGVVGDGRIIDVNINGKTLQYLVRGVKSSRSYNAESKDIDDADGLLMYSGNFYYIPNNYDIDGGKDYVFVSPLPFISQQYFSVQVGRNDISAKDRPLVYVPILEYKYNKSDTLSPVEVEFIIEGDPTIYNDRDKLFIRITTISHDKQMSSKDHYLYKDGIIDKDGTIKVRQFLKAACEYKYRVYVMENESKTVHPKYITIDSSMFTNIDFTQVYCRLSRETSSSEIKLHINQPLSISKGRYKTMFDIYEMSDDGNGNLREVRKIENSDTVDTVLTYITTAIGGSDQNKYSEYRFKVKNDGIYKLVLKTHSDIYNRRILTEDGINEVYSLSINDGSDKYNKINVYNKNPKRKELPNGLYWYFDDITCVIDSDPKEMIIRAGGEYYLTVISFKVQNYIKIIKPKGFEDAPILVLKDSYFNGKFTINEIIGNSLNNVDLSKKIAYWAYEKGTYRVYYDKDNKVKTKRYYSSFINDIGNYYETIEFNGSPIEYELSFNGKYGKIDNSNKNSKIIRFESAGLDLRCKKTGESEIVKNIDNLYIGFAVKDQSTGKVYVSNTSKFVEKIGDIHHRTGKVYECANRQYLQFDGSHIKDPRTAKFTLYRLGPYIKYVNSGDENRGILTLIENHTYEYDLFTKTHKLFKTFANETDPNEVREYAWSKEGDEMVEYGNEISQLESQLSKLKNSLDYFNLLIKYGQDDDKLENQRIERLSNTIVPLYTKRDDMFDNILNVIIPKNVTDVVYSKREEDVDNLINSIETNISKNNKDISKTENEINIGINNINSFDKIIDSNINEIFSDIQKLGGKQAILNNTQNEINRINTFKAEYDSDKAKIDNIVTEFKDNKNIILKSFQRSRDNLILFQDENNSNKNILDQTIGNRNSLINSIRKNIDSINKDDIDMTEKINKLNESLDILNKHNGSIRSLFKDQSDLKLKYEEKKSLLSTIKDKNFEVSNEYNALEKILEIKRNDNSIIEEMNNSIKENLISNIEPLKIIKEGNESLVKEYKDKLAEIKSLVDANLDDIKSDKLDLESKAEVIYKFITMLINLDGSVRNTHDILKGRVAFFENEHSSHKYRLIKSKEEMIKEYDKLNEIYAKESGKDAVARIKIVLDNPYDKESKLNKINVLSKEHMDQMSKIVSSVNKVKLDYENTMLNRFLAIDANKRIEIYSRYINEISEWIDKYNKQLDAVNKEIENAEENNVVDIINEKNENLISLQKYITVNYFKMGEISHTNSSNNTEIGKFNSLIEYNSSKIKELENRINELKPVVSDYNNKILDGDNELDIINGSLSTLKEKISEKIEMVDKNYIEVSKSLEDLSTLINDYKEGIKDSGEEDKIRRIDTNLEIIKTISDDIINMKEVDIGVYGLENTISTLNTNIRENSRNITSYTNRNESIDRNILEITKYYDEYSNKISEFDRLIQTKNKELESVKSINFDNEKDRLNGRIINNKSNLFKYIRNNYNGAYKLSRLKAKDIKFKEFKNDLISIKNSIESSYDKNGLKTIDNKIYVKMLHDLDKDINLIIDNFATTRSKMSEKSIVRKKYQKYAYLNKVVDIDSSTMTVISPYETWREELWVKTRDELQKAYEEAYKIYQEVGNPGEVIDKIEKDYYERSKAKAHRDKMDKIPLDITVFLAIQRPDNFNIGSVQIDLMDKKGLKSDGWDVRFLTFIKSGINEETGIILKEDWMNQYPFEHSTFALREYTATIKRPKSGSIEIVPKNIIRTDDAKYGYGSIFDKYYDLYPYSYAIDYDDYKDRRHAIAVFMLFGKES